MRTRYVIRRLEDGKWWGYWAWTDDHDLRQCFDAMSLAAWYALATLQLGGYEFEVEPV